MSRYNKRHWYARYNAPLTAKEMSVSHIENSIAFLIKQKSTEEWDHIERQKFEDWKNHWLNRFQKELERRLKKKPQDNLRLSYDS